MRTREPASPTSILQTELARDSSLKTVSEFDKTNLKKAETLEKNPLPSSEAIAQELEHLKFKAGIEGYDQSSLSHTTTVEKNTLPTQVFINSCIHIICEEQIYFPVGKLKDLICSIQWNSGCIELFTHFCFLCFLVVIPFGFIIVNFFISILQLD